MRKSLILAIATTSMVSLTSQAMAQDAARDADGDADSSTQAGADEIIVTAQKRSERILDVPISITVVSGDAINRAAAKNMSELQGIAPGVYFSGNTGYSNSPIGIRGTAGTNSTLLDDPVAVYINGVYQPSGYLGSTGLLDIASIQVVRGPQGTLQGRNATAGAILIDSAEPTDSFSGYVRTSYADPSEVRGEAAVSGPISSTLSARVALGYYNEEGWAKNFFTGTRIAGGHGFQARGTLRWNPSDNFTAKMIVGHNSTYAKPAVVRWAQTPFNPAPGGALVLPGTATPTVPLPEAERDAITDDFLYSLNRPTFSRVTDTSLALNMILGLGAVDLVSITGYNDVKNTGSSDSDGLARTDREGFNTGTIPAKYFSQELRLQSSGSGPFRWIVGGYYSRAAQGLDFLIHNAQLTLATRTTTHYIDRQVTNSYAGFADATFEVTPQISLIGGIRFTRETKDFRLDRTALNFDTQQPTGATFLFRPDQAVYKNTSYRLKATFEPAPDTLFYISYSTGFKSGGFNAFGTDAAFLPEKLRSAEAGFKARFLDRRATVALSAYTNRYDDLQIRAGVSTGGVALTNAADSKIDGFEFEANYNPTDEISLSGNLSYTRARFKRFPTARNLLEQPVDAAGNSLPRTPEWQYYLQASYRPTLSEGVTGLLETSWRWRDRVYFYHTDQGAFTVQGQPLGELGARAGFTWEDRNLTIAAFVNNLTDARSINNINFTFSYPIVSFNKPRSIGIQLETKF